MQNESTPSRQIYGNIITPYSTAIDRQTGRKRKIHETSLSEDSHIGGSFNSSIRPSLHKYTPDTTTKYLRSPSQTSPHRRRSSPQLRQTPSPKDVFLDDGRVSTLQLRTAATQFHDAARRLALGSSADNDKTTVSPSKTTSAINKHRRNAAKHCNFSRTFRGRPGTTEPASLESLQKRDITSAKRDGLGISVSDYNFATPVKFQQYAGLPNPVSILQNHQSVCSSPPHTIRQVRNFSRLVRPYNSQNLQSLSRTPKKSPRRKHPEGNGLPRNFSRPVRPSHSQTLQQVLRTPKKLPNCTYNEENQSQLRPDLIGKPEQLSQTANSSTSHLERKKSFNPSIFQTTIEIQDGEPAVSPSIHESIFELRDYVREEDLTDHRRQLKHWQIWLQRIAVMFFVFGINLGLGLAYFKSHKHPYLLGILVFMKSKDILSTIADLLGILHHHFHRLIWPPKEPDSRWILSLVCAYAETEEQIMKTVKSLAANDTVPHKQVICIILDGKPRDIVSKMDVVRVEFERPYVTWRGVQGHLKICAGTIQKIPMISICKGKNAGKKDSLILGHDLFNYPRKNMPHSTKLLREEIWQLTMPHLVSRKQLTAFDFIFCTDADSTIHEKCLQKLANALCETTGAIAGCGVLFAEFGEGWAEFSPWHLFQQFQYTFGQYVRRQSESTFGRVTCLPGCVTMIVVRPELGDALSEYARPVTGGNLLRHQVQYLGTDRRLTWCMLSQNKHLRTVFVPEALSETVTPSNLSHYISQRRRWASNAYFNDFFYLFGPQQRLGTRLFAAIDIVRLTLVYYRVFNTAYFIHGLATNFYVIKIIPTLIVTKTPATWYLLLVLIKEPILRKRVHKVVLGMIINQIISPILSVIVFTNVLLHIGSQAWGKTGASSQGHPATGLHHNTEPSRSWTPGRLARSVREAIRGLTPARMHRSDRMSPKSSIAANPMSQTPSKSSVMSKSKQSPARARSSSVSNHNSATEPAIMNMQQTPARKLFQYIASTPSSIYRRNPHQQNSFGTIQQGTPTKNVKQKSGTEFDFE